MTKYRKSDEVQHLNYAIYCRYSDEIQNDLSLESQEMMCREEITRRGGHVVRVYKDAAKFGWSLDREDFKRMRSDAEHGQFEAIMMWKFDRLARDHSQVTIIKALLRHEYKIRLFCVEGFSEDDDSGPYTAMMEQMLAVFSAFYSKNLSTEVSRANRHRHSNGKLNGSKPPFGYILATDKQPKRANCVKATSDMPSGLHIDPRAAVLVRWAFRLYAMGTYSYATLAQFLTQKAVLLRHSLDKPFHPQTVRDMIQNKTYCGYVSYSETVYTRGFGQGKAGIRGRRQWDKGIHSPIISEALFDQCQAVRGEHSRMNKNPHVVEDQLLTGLIYCARCLDRKKPDLKDANFGKMYVHAVQNHWRYYECAAVRRGYDRCGQRMVRQENIDNQVIAALHNLHERLPPNVAERIEAIMREHAENAAAVEKMEQIAEMIKKIELKWDHGFMDDDTYVQQRRELQIQIEMMRPVEHDELLKSANLLKDFAKLWAACHTRKAQHELVSQILEQVIVLDKKVIALVLKGDSAQLIETNGLSPDGERGI